MSEDIFVPASSAAEALVSPLRTITYVTADPDRFTAVLVDGLSLETNGWQTPAAEESEAVCDYLGMPAGTRWQVASFYRSGAIANVGLRVFAVGDSNPLIRPEINGRYVGGLSIGFPMADMEDREARLADLGIESSVGVKRLEFTSPSGEVYVSGEIHFMTDEHAFLLGVSRPASFVPVGPIDTETGIGAPAYSARCVDNPETVMQFLTDVLGFEIRRDATLTVGEKSGLRLATGMDERFIQAFAPGASSGYLVLLDHADENLPSPAATLGPPSRGMAMWTFASQHFDAVRQRAEQFGCEVVLKPNGVDSPLLGPTRAMRIVDPGGFPIEIIESA